MTWFRVTDRAHPLWGLEVCGEERRISMYQRPSEDVIEVESVRRFDVFIGDRPLQISRVRGMYLAREILEKSPFQGEIEAELSAPYGKCLKEGEVIVSTSGVSQDVARYAIFERATQVSLVREDLTTGAGHVLGSFTKHGQYLSEIVEVLLKRFVDPIALRDALIDGSFFSGKGGE